MLGSDWESFEAAAMRVRILDHSDFIRWRGVAYDLDSSIFRSLASAAQGLGRPALLPRLQQLTWKISNNDIFPYLSLFLSPTIANLTVYITTGSITSTRARFSLFTSLASQCSSIPSVNLRALGCVTHSWRDLFSGCSSTANASFGLWAGLGSLTLYCMDLSALTDDLARLPVLTTLVLNDCRKIDPALPSAVKGFPMLRYLDVYSSNIDSCLHILQRMSCTPLIRLNLRIAGTSCESQWVELFSILPNGISRDTLTTLRFSSPAHGHPVPLRFQTISPLLQFRCISHLTCARDDSAGLNAGLDLDDSDVACIAKAWPCLKLISICPPGSAPSRLTLRALIPFADYCPELEDLSMKMNATAFELNDYEEKPGKGCGRLWRLHVFDSPIDNQACVAAFISDIFPNVRRISSIFGAHERKPRRKWYEVKRNAPLFAAVRRQEANRKISCLTCQPPKMEAFVG